MAIEIFDLKNLRDIYNIRVLDLNIPCGYIANSGGMVKYEKRQVVEIYVDTDDINFLRDLSDDLVVQIGDTFYRKDGNSFVNDYLNQSHDFQQELDAMTRDEPLKIMYDFECK
jgi:hypothetical protein